ncbi:MAG: aspartate carbamoyltransferase catalytic subunit [bacterium]
MQLKSKDLLGLEHMSREEIELVLETAKLFEEVSGREIKKVPTLRGKTIINLFFEVSTRTRTSFELAGKRLSGDVINIQAGVSSIAKGETLLDTGKALDAMNADIVVIRHSSSGASHLLAKYSKFSVINAGDGMHEHPTQALLDMFTILKEKKRIEGLKVVIVGDVLHSRVARSNIWGMKKLGAEITVVAPPTFLPMDIEKMGVEVSYNLDESIKKADVVYLLRIQQERQKKGFLPDIREYSKLFGLNQERLSLAKKDILLMHPGPINRGVEISPDVADGPLSLINEQVTSGVAVRMAVLYLLGTRK